MKKIYDTLTDPNYFEKFIKIRSVDLNRTSLFSSSELRKPLYLWSRILFKVFLHVVYHILF